MHAYLGLQRTKIEEGCDKPEDAIGRYVTWLEYEHRCKGIERTISELEKVPKVN